MVTLHNGINILVCDINSKWMFFPDPVALYYEVWIRVKGAVQRPAHAQQNHTKPLRLQIRRSLALLSLDFQDAGRATKCLSIRSLSS